MTNLSNRRAGGILMSCAALCAAAPSAAQATSVDVRIEGAKRTLVRQTTVTTPKVAVPPRAPAEQRCAGSSGLGALQAATKGRWSGTFNEGLGYFVETIRGETHGGSPDFWTFWVNGKPSEVGLCGYTPKKGDDVLFFVDRCDFDEAAGECSNKPVLPLEIVAPRKAERGSAFSVRVRALTPGGKAVPAAGAVIRGRGVRAVKTGRNGVARVVATRAGKVNLRAYSSGAIRSEFDPVKVAS